MAGDIEELKQLVLDLSARCDQLETRVRELESNSDTTPCKRSSRVRTKQISTIHKPSSYHSPTCDFNTWLNILKDAIKQEHLDLVFEHGFMQGYKIILEEVLSMEHPFSTYGAKARGKFMICSNLSSTLDNNNTWTIIADSTLKQISHTISKPLMKYLMEWQSNNLQNIKSDSFAIEFSENIKKAIGGGYTVRQINNHIQKVMYMIIRENGM